MHISSSFQGHLNYAFNSRNLPLNVWTKIEITMVEIAANSYRYTIVIDGPGSMIPLEHTVTGKIPAGVFKNMKMWASDSYFPAANGEIKNIDLITPYPKGKLF